MTSILRCAVAAIIAAVVGTGLAVTQSAQPAQAATDPASLMTSPAYSRVKPGDGTQLITPWRDEATGAVAYGFSVDQGTPFTVSTVSAAGLTPVRRLFKGANVDFTWALSGSTRLSAATGSGYADQGTNFWAYATNVAGTQAVNSYTKNGVHRLALAGAGAALTGAGWASDGVAFYVPGGTTPVTPPTTTPPPPPTTPSTPTGGAGALPIGQAKYAVPSNAIVAAPNGNDSAAGTVAAPVRTLARALAIAPANSTIVLRAGTYHESVAVSRTVTIENYPGEAVWLDGSVPVTGWVADGSGWRKDGWTQRFDHSPTYTPGAADSTVANWQFVNSTYPMAAYPDQVFIDGVQQNQVKTRSQLVAGTFYLDEATSKLYLGTNPNGRSVSASTLIRAMQVQAPSTVVRGIGIRRYSPSVWHMGAVTVEQPNVRFENVSIEDSATTGISIQRAGVVLDSVTIARSGMLGIHGRNADNLTLNRVLSTQNNREHFNIAPVSGGAKFGVTRGIKVTASSFSGNYGHGFWDDMSVYDTTLVGSQFTDNDGDGIFLEISAKAVIANNFIARNKMDGAKINNVSDVKVWNNTFLANAGRPFWLAQDSRRNTNPNDPAVDKRMPFPDPAMPWTLGPVTIRNNVIVQNSTGGNSLIDNEDYSGQKSAAQMGITLDGNVYQRQSAGSPTWLIIWSRGAGNPAVYTTLAAFKSGTGQEARGREYVGGANLVDAQGNPTGVVTGIESGTAVGVPADIAALVGRAAGTVHLGKW